MVKYKINTLSPKDAFTVFNLTHEVADLVFTAIIDDTHGITAVEASGRETTFLKGATFKEIVE